MTDLAQSDNPSLGCVLPSVLALNKFLQAKGANVQYTSNMVKKLHDSLHSRFGGLFHSVDVPHKLVASAKVVFTLLV